jgi:RND family efflux transporter MFP subunit
MHGLRLIAIRLITFMAVAVGMVAGCRNNNPAPKAPPLVKVSVGQPTREPVIEYGEYTGYTEAVQRIEIRPRVRGRIMKVHVPEGTEIEKGTLLYEIDPDEYQVAKDRAVAAQERAIADRQRAMAELDKARADLARVKPLRGTNALSEEQYLQFDVAEKTAVAAVAQADASIEQAKAEVAAAELNLSFTKIYAPISGRVSRTLITEGNLVGFDFEQNVLTIMVDVDPIYVYFDVPERDIIEYEAWAKPLRNVGPAAQALGLPLWTGLWSDGVIPLAVGIETEPGYPHLGWINFREPRFEPGTGTLRLRGILDNADRKLSSGMYARVKFPKRWPRERLTLPAECILSGQQGRYVYLVEDPASDADPPPPPPPDPNYAVKRVKGPVTIEVGTLVGRRMVVKEKQPGDEARGLTASDVVITEGFQKVRPGAYVLVPIHTP